MALLTTRETIIYSILLVLTFLLGIIGNCAVCLAVYFNKTLRQQVSNIFLVNLAVTDFLTVLLVIPFCVVNILEGDWIFGTEWCVALAFAYYTLAIVAMESLAFISLDRYLAIVHPLRYKTKMTVQRIQLMLLSGWIWAVAFVLPCVFLGWFKYGFTESMCTYNFSGTGEKWKTRVIVYGVVTITLCIILPSFVMFYSYIKILTIVNHHLNRVGTVIPKDEPRRSLSVRLQGQIAAVAAPEYRGYRTIGLVIAVFLVSWLPFSVTRLIKTLTWDHEAVPAVVDTFATVSSFLSAAVNPVAYGLFRKDFRKAFRKLFWQIFGGCRRQKPFGQVELNRPKNMQLATDYNAQLD